MHLIRQHILEILKEHSSATVAELAQRLDMAPVSVRHHLDILQGDSLIQVERLAHTGAVGRPKLVYALTPSADAYFPDNSAALASGLLRQMRALLPPEKFDKALQALAREFSAEFSHGEENSDEPGPVTKERLDQVVTFLNSHGYLARWEKVENVDTDPHSIASNNGRDSYEEHGPIASASDKTKMDVYLVHKCNCPYSDVVTEERDLCQMDHALMENLLGQACVRIQSMADDGPHCTYRVALKESQIDASMTAEPQ